MNTRDGNKTQDNGNKLKGHHAKEIETRPMAGKLGFIANDGAYHVFHDFGIAHVRNYRDGESEILEMECSRHLVVIRGFKLEILVNLFLDSELFRVRITPKEAHEKYRAEGICFVSDMEIGIAMDDDDDFPDQ